MEINYSAEQYDFFFGDSVAKYNIMTKGRRVGFTHGASYAVIQSLIKQDTRALWIDTIYSNIDRYFERYFLPVLKDADHSQWEWRKQSKELMIGSSICDFRSADRAENIEGFGYHKIFLNEAGIILKGERGRYIWFNAVLPMTMDYSDCQVFIGGTPKGKRDKTGEFTTYYNLYSKCETNKNYRHINIPTDKNPFIDADAVQEVKQELPEGAVRDQEFYGKFVESGQSIIDRSSIHISSIPLEGQKVRSWDLAVTIKTSSDFSAGALCCMSGNRMQIQDMKKVKLLWPELKELILTTAEYDGTEIPIIVENAGQQNALIEDLRDHPRARKFTIHDIKPKGDKLARLMPWASRLRSGRVDVLEGDWNSDFINEICALTPDDTHAHDDQADAVSQAYGAFSDGLLSSGVLFSL